VVSHCPICESPTPTPGLCAPCRASPALARAFTEGRERHVGWEPLAELQPMVDAVAGVVWEGGMSVTIRAVQDTVCAHYSLSRDLLLSHKRTRFIARPRQIAMWLCRKLTTGSTTAIGQAFGGRDHTTVLHGVATIEHLMTREPLMAVAVAELRALLSGGAS
jgi:hypothetical protein